MAALNMNGVVKIERAVNQIMCNNYNTIEQQGQVPIKAWTKGVPFEDGLLN